MTHRKYCGKMRCSSYLCCSVLVAFVAGKQDQSVNKTRLINIHLSKLGVLALNVLHDFHDVAHFMPNSEHRSLVLLCHV